MFVTLAGPRGRHGRSPFRTLVLLAGLALAAVPAVVAADPSDAPGAADARLTRDALRALDADPQLRDINLLVSVADGVAVVGGPVPSADHGKRAEAVVRGVRGVAEVKNRCFVAARPDPLIRAVADRVATGPRPFADLPGIAPGPKGEAPPPMTGYAAAPDPNPVVALRPANSADGVLLPPVGATPRPDLAPVPAPTPTPPPTGTLIASPPGTPVATVPGKPADVLTAAEAARKADARFAGLTIELRDGTLVIGGTAARASDAWDFAQALRKLPGVARVAVGNVALK